MADFIDLSAEIVKKTLRDRQRQRDRESETRCHAAAGHPDATDCGPRGELCAACNAWVVAFIRRLCGLPPLSCYDAGCQKDLGHKGLHAARYVGMDNAEIVEEW